IPRQATELPLGFPEPPVIAVDPSETSPPNTKCRRDLCNEPRVTLELVQPALSPAKTPLLRACDEGERGVGRTLCQPRRLRGKPFCLLEPALDRGTPRALHGHVAASPRFGNLPDEEGKGLDLRVDGDD